jgi:ABC-type nitrate/sulfonate/bicarbonate transport system permease component
MMPGAARYSWVRQVVALLILLALWEAAGRAGMLNPLYLPSPSQIGAALVDLFSDGRIWPHLEATFTAALGGLVLGRRRSWRCCGAGAVDRRTARAGDDAA